MLSDEETNFYVDTKHYSRIIDLGVTLSFRISLNGDRP